MDVSLLKSESTVHNNVNIKIDSSTFTLDLDHRTWIGPGDFLNVDFTDCPKSPPRLSIVDGQNPKQQLMFDCNSQVAFDCIFLSTFTEYFTFSIEHRLSLNDKYVWQVEILRDRIPDAIRGQPNLYHSQVNFFFNRLMPKTAHPGPERGSGGGFQLN